MPSSTLRVGGPCASVSGRRAAITAFPRRAWERDHDVKSTPIERYWDQANVGGVYAALVPCRRASRDRSGADLNLGLRGAPRLAEHRQPLVARRGEDHRRTDQEHDRQADVERALEDEPRL